MANILKVNEQNTIQQLAAQGWSRRRIARALKVDRKTVRRYLKTAAKSPTISTPGSGGAESKSPPISTAGESEPAPAQALGPELVSEALDARISNSRTTSCVSVSLPLRSSVHKLYEGK